MSKVVKHDLENKLLIFASFIFLIRSPLSNDKIYCTQYCHCCRNMIRSSFI